MRPLVLLTFLSYLSGGCLIEHTPPQDDVTNLLLFQDLSSRINSTRWPAIKVQNASGSGHTMAFCSFSDCSTPRSWAHDFMEIDLASGEITGNYYAMVNGTEDGLVQGRHLVYLRIDGTIFSDEEDLLEFYSSPPLTLADRATEFNCTLTGSDVSDFQCVEEVKETLSGDIAY